MTCPMPDDVCEHCGYRCCDSVSDGSREAGETEGLDPKDDSAMTEGQTPIPSPSTDKDLVARCLSTASILDDNGFDAAADDMRSLLSRLSSLTKALEKIARRAANSDGDTDDDRLRDLRHIHEYARSALATKEKSDNE